MKNTESVLTFFRRDFLRPLNHAYDPFSRALLALAIYVTLLLIIECWIAPRPIFSDAIFKRPYIPLILISGLLFISQAAPLFFMYREGVRSAIIIIIIIVTFNVALLTTILVTMVAMEVVASASTAVLVGGLSAFAVSTSLLIQALSSSHVSRRAHTFNVLMQSRTSEEFQRHTKGRDPYYSAGKLIPTEDYDRYWHQNRSEDFIYSMKKQLNEQRAACGDEQAKAELEAQLTSALIEIENRREAMRSLKYMMNFYEFVCGGIIARDLDRDLIELTVRDIMINLYEDTALIREKIAKDHPAAFDNLRKVIASRWLNDKELARRINDRAPWRHLHGQLSEMRAKYRAAPSACTAVVLAEKSEIRIGLMRWGWIPPKARHLNSARSSLTLPMGELTSPKWRQSWESCRCVVPFSDYGEVSQPQAAERPYRLRRRDHRELWAPAIWTPAHPRLQEKEMDGSFSIVTKDFQDSSGGTHFIPAFLTAGVLDTYLRATPKEARKILESTQMPEIIDGTGRLAPREQPHKDYA